MHIILSKSAPPGKGFLFPLTEQLVSMIAEAALSTMAACVCVCVLINDLGEP